MRPYNHAFTHKLFQYINYAEIQSNTNLSVTNWSVQTCLSRLVGLQSFSSSIKLHAQKLKLRLFFFTVSSSALCDCLCVSFPVCKLNYKMLLLFIGNLKIATAWADLLADLLSIKHCNNYLPNNLASEINLIELRCLLVDFSFLSD